jgi:hypothetical protein
MINPARQKKNLRFSAISLKKELTWVCSLQICTKSIVRIFWRTNIDSSETKINSGDNSWHHRQNIVYTDSFHETVVACQINASHINMNALTYIMRLHTQVLKLHKYSLWIYRNMILCNEGVWPFQDNDFAKERMGLYSIQLISYRGTLVG